VVDDLLALARDQELYLEWRGGHCQVRQVASGEVVEVAMPRSAFRAVLARVAALCNERIPGSVSPYGGDAELPPDAGMATLIRVSFVNTPAEQRVQLVRAAKGEKPRIPDTKLRPAHNPIAPTTPAGGS
jgi:hypothetical protein